MCESHVSGCQFAARPVVNAQANERAVTPAAMSGFFET
jgi:hypothetical protein